MVPTLLPLQPPLLLLLLLGSSGSLAEPGSETESSIRTLQLETLVEPPEACSEAAAFGDTLHIHYTGSLEDGRIVDTSLTRDPLVIELGQKQVIPGDAVLQFEVELIALVRASYWQKVVKTLFPLLGMCLVPALLGLIGYYLYSKASSPKISKKKLREEKKNKSKKK